LGKLHAEVCPRNELGRDELEELAGAMARNGLISIADCVFEKDGKQIPYRTAQLTREGACASAEDLASLQLKEAQTARRAPRKTAPDKPKRNKQASAVDDPLMKALREWRLGEAKRHSLPTFRICSDRILSQIVEDRPAGEDDLLAISGIGPHFVKNYGEKVLTIVRQSPDASI
jgi:superfamily II DNA helicase RecQ